MTLSKQHITEIQSQGLRWIDTDKMGLNRRGGAGPTDHKALSFAQQTSMVPVLSEQADSSPFSAQVDDSGTQVLIFEEDKLLGSAQLPSTPNFYKLSTADGIPYSHIATLHSTNVLATTVLQTCVRYRNRETSCQFCAIEESLVAGKTIAEKTPAQLAEVAKAAVELDCVEQMIMTTGTPAGRDRGAKVLAECAAAIKQAVNIPIQAQCEPPADDSWFQRLKDAGVDALGMHLEAVTDRVRKQIMPGKATVPLSRYFSAYKAAVKVFGEGNVSTYILAGLGDTEDEILSMSQKLIDIGVYPFVVPFVPVAGTPLADAPMADSAMLDRLFNKLGPAISARGIYSSDQAAGCAKCGACSSLKSYEQQNKRRLTAASTSNGQAAVSENKSTETENNEVVRYA